VMGAGIDVKPLITATYRIDEFQKAMEDFDKNPDHVKIRLIP